MQVATDEAGMKDGCKEAETLKQRVKKHREQDLKEIETSTNEN
jgi:hypothetical protein